MFNEQNSLFVVCKKSSFVFSNIFIDVLRVGKKEKYSNVSYKKKKKRKLSENVQRL